MAKQIWGPAIIIPAVALIASVVIFLGIALFLDMFYDYSLWLGTLIFIVISAVAWMLASRAEKEFQEQNPDAGEHH